jgi:6-hydroxycyclohex-1-ene-1-carbonyl-CoA dehydrogenase
LGIVGFTLAKLEVRLSNLMAFDARLIGNWGADSAIYPEAIGMVLDGSLDLAPFTGLYPLSEINDVIAKAHGEGLEHRAVLVP